MLIAFAVPAQAGETRPAAERAVALLDAGRPGEAFEVLAAAVEAQPDDPGLLLLLGRAGVAAAFPPGAPAGAVRGEAREAYIDAAIAALRRILTIRPQEARARLDLARAFFLKGEDSLARRHFERVLAGRPPPAVVANVQRYLDAIRERKRWSGYFGVALAPDTNIGAASDDDVLWLPAFGTELPFRVNPDSKPSSGIGLLAWGGVEYQHPAGERGRLRVGMDLWRQEHTGARFDRMLIAGHAGPRWLAGPAHEFSLLGSVRTSRAAGRREYTEPGLRLEAAQRLGRRLVARQQASWHRRRYRDSGSLDGPVRSASLNLRWQATPILSLGATAGYAAESPRLSWRRNTRPWAGLSVDLALPRGFTVGAAADVSRTTYSPGAYWRAFTRGASRREDRNRTYRLTLLNRAVTLGGFSPQVALIYEERESNAQLSGFRRTRGELRAVRQF